MITLILLTMIGIVAAICAIAYILFYGFIFLDLVVFFVIIMGIIAFMQK